MILAIRKLPLGEVGRLKAGSIYVSLMDPFNEKETIEAFVAGKVTAVSMEMIPRITRAQKMDVLSSQANLAGAVRFFEQLLRNAAGAPQSPSS